MENLMPSLNQIVKPALLTKLGTRNIPNFLPKLDSNKSLQSGIWARKTYLVNPKTHVFTTIQEHFGNRLIHSIKLPKNAVAVDIGCFIGEKLWQLNRPPGCLGVGVDIAMPSLAAAKKIDPFSDVFIAADVENLPFKDNSVDFVIAFDVIEHLTHPEKGFSEINRVLKPGGQLLLHIPIKNNKWSLFWFKQKILPTQAEHDYKEVGHSPTRMLTTFQVQQFLKQNNLKVDWKTLYNSFFVHFWDREFFKILSAVSEKKLSTSKTLQIVKENSYRNIYGKYVVPILETLSTPDLLLSALQIGNSYFCLATKRPL
jgi:ubiquinone/menaquinone biosynthesis C-methylase UbiE